MTIAETVIDYADKLRAALIAHDTAAERRLVSAYRGIYDTIVSRIDNIVLKIKDGGELSVGQVRKLKEYERLLSEVEQQLTGYGAFARSEISEAAKIALQMGEEDGRQLIATALGDITFVPRLHSLHSDAIESLLGFLDPSGPLYERLNALPGYTAEQIAQAILNGVGLGQNPQVIARAITNAFGMALTDSMRMMRTAQLYAYREANRASYLANSDVVKGWQWYAHIPGACMSCVAMHGSIHSLDERLNDHYNGKCISLPVTILYPDGHIQEGAGKQWFDGLTEAEQRKLMGNGKFEAWKNGKFNFEQLSTMRPDAVYGDMRIETGLLELLGLRQ